jgi:hypothetical protein
MARSFIKVMQDVYARKDWRHAFVHWLGERIRCTGATEYMTLSGLRALARSEISKNWAAAANASFFHYRTRTSTSRP